GAVKDVQRTTCQRAADRDQVGGRVGRVERLGSAVGDGLGRAVDVHDPAAGQGGQRRTQDGGRQDLAAELELTQAGQLGRVGVDDLVEQRGGQEAGGYALGADELAESLDRVVPGGEHGEPAAVGERAPD